MQFVQCARMRGFDSPTLVIRDNDTKFGRRFDGALARAGAASQRIPVRAPLLNAYVERWIKSIKHECLNHFVPIGITHLDHIIAEYVEHYNTERPHQGMGNRPLTATGPPVTAGRIVCREHLGGPLMHYERIAA